MSGNACPLNQWISFTVLTLIGFVSFINVNEREMSACNKSRSNLICTAVAYSLHDCRKSKFIFFSLIIIRLLCEKHDKNGADTLDFILNMK